MGGTIAFFVVDFRIVQRCSNHALAGWGNAFVRGEPEMRTSKRFQNVTREFCFASGAFNLYSEVGPDSMRVMLDNARDAKRREEAAEFERKMQRVLAECPGFVGCDAPAGASSSGKVMVEPGRICEAMPWLKRRFHVNENLELSTDSGLCVEVAFRIRGAAKKPRVKRFGKPEQFELGL